MKIKTLRIFAIVLWVSLSLSALFTYFFYPEVLHQTISKSLSGGILVAYIVFLLLGAIRGFTLIPSTYLIILGLLFFRPWPLFFITLSGTIISSASVYFFAESLGIHHYLEKRHKKQVDKVTNLVQKNELPIIIAWSFFPFTPTDVICYVCGILEVDFKKFLLGIFIGEGICTALYVFLGQSILQLLHLSF